MLVVGVEQGDGEVVLGESWPGENCGKEGRYQERRPAEPIGKDRKFLSFDFRLTPFRSVRFRFQVPGTIYWHRYTALRFAETASPHTTAIP